MRRCFWRLDIRRRNDGFGAASLTNAFTELAGIFEKKHPGLSVNTNYAASNPLLKQIVEGAPVDVFASADQATMDKAGEAKVVDPATRKNFAANDLVLIVPKNSQMPTYLRNLEKFGRIAVGNHDSVPAGRYTRDALIHAGLYDKLKDKYIQGSERAPGTGLCCAGRSGRRLRLSHGCGTDEGQGGHSHDRGRGHDPVTYPIAVAITGNNPKAGQEFLNFVLFAGRPGSTGQIRILKAVAHGFFLSLALWKSLF